MIGDAKQIGSGKLLCHKRTFRFGEEPPVAKVAMLAIDSCWACPFGLKGFCHAQTPPRSTETTLLSTTYPSWCPLEDAYEEDAVFSPQMEKIPNRSMRELAEEFNEENRK